MVAQPEVGLLGLIGRGTNPVVWLMCGHGRTVRWALQSTVLPEEPAIG